MVDTQYAVRKSGKRAARDEIDELPSMLRPQPKKSAAKKPHPDRADPENGAWMVGRKRLAQSLMLEERGPGGGSRVMAVVIICFVAAFLVWASHTRISEVVVTSGEVSPVGSIKTVQHLEGGIVQSIDVAEGDLVDQGQILLTLDSSTVQSELEQMQTRLVGLELEADQLSAMMTGAPLASNNVGQRHQGLATTQALVIEAKRHATETQLDVIKKQIAQRNADTRLLINQAAAVKRQIGFIEEEVAMRRTLLEKGLMSKVVMLENQRELARTQAQLAEVIGKQRRNAEAISELESRQAEVSARISMVAAESLGKTANEIAELKDAIAEVRSRVERLDIQSPVRGIVQTLAVKTLGGVVASGATVAEIIPEGADLVVEARVSTQDIGFIYEGQAARVKVEAYDFTRYGDVTGKILRISATTFEDEKGNPYYKSYIRLDKNYVGQDPKRNLVVPGMTVIADIRTGEKTLSEYLLKPIYKAMSEAFRER